MTGQDGHTNDPGQTKPKAEPPNAIDQAIREWAAEHGIPVSAAEPIPPEVIASYAWNA